MFLTSLLVACLSSSLLVTCLHVLSEFKNCYGKPQLRNLRCFDKCHLLTGSLFLCTPSNHMEHHYSHIANGTSLERSPIAISTWGPYLSTRATPVISACLLKRVPPLFDAKIPKRSCGTVLHAYSPQTRDL